MSLNMFLLAGRERWSWYYNKSISRGDTSDFIDNVENVFVCWGQILEGSVQNNF